MKKKKALFFISIITGLVAVVLAVFLPRIIARIKFRNVARIISEENQARATASIRDSFSIREMNIIMDENSATLLNVNMDVAYSADDETVFDELLQRHAEIHFEISNLISQKSFTNIDEESEKMALKKQIVSHINSILTNGQIEKVYFEEYLFLDE